MILEENIEEKFLNFGLVSKFYTQYQSTIYDKKILIM